ncbi:tRNA-modifying protein YgfZ [Buchnera aphidicola]|uniref:tRNA-modifying protein YgfZ n=1 Tax=Buchnera aphidicola TaxID=9 RepID=UPI003463A4EF
MYNNLCCFEILKHWSITRVTGIDSTKYLNSQITVNLFNLKDNNHILCAHCSANGKVHSILRLFHYDNGYMYIQRHCTTELQIFELKKYSIFSNIQINTISEYFLLGVMGMHAKNILLLYFNNLPNHNSPLIILKDIIILWFPEPIERFLVICKKNDLFLIKNFLLKKLIPMVYDKWLFLDITAGIPILEEKMSKKFFPQNMNLELLHAIDFNKGCYCGQEMIAKIHFKKTNYKKLFCLIGISYDTIDLFSTIEVFQNFQWKKIGKIFFIFYVQHNIFILQCILKNSDFMNCIFRIHHNKKSKFFIF